MLNQEVNSSAVNGNDFGLVTSVKDGVVAINGLGGAMAGELILVNQSVEGVVLNVEDNSIKAIIFDTDDQVEEGFGVERTETILNVPTGMELLGRVVDSLGNPIDDLDDIEVEEEDFVDVEIKAPGIISRKSVHQPPQTGTTAIDAMIPVGRGQRELIIGDNQMAVLLMAILNGNEEDRRDFFHAHSPVMVLSRWEMSTFSFQLYVVLSRLGGRELNTVYIIVDASEAHQLNNQSVDGGERLLITIESEGELIKAQDSKNCVMKVLNGLEGRILSNMLFKSDVTSAGRQAVGIAGAIAGGYYSLILADLTSTSLPFHSGTTLVGVLAPFSLIGIVSSLIGGVHGHCPPELALTGIRSFLYLLSPRLGMCVAEFEGAVLSFLESFMVVESTVVLPAASSQMNGIGMLIGTEWVFVERKHLQHFISKAFKLAHPDHATQLPNPAVLDRGGAIRNVRVALDNGKGSYVLNNMRADALHLRHGVLESGMDKTIGREVDTFNNSIGQAKSCNDLPGLLRSFIEIPEKLPKSGKPTGDSGTFTSNGINNTERVLSLNRGYNLRFASYCVPIGGTNVQMLRLQAGDISGSMAFKSHQEFLNALQNAGALVGIENKVPDGASHSTLDKCRSSKHASETSVVALKFESLKAATNSEPRNLNPKGSGTVVFNPNMEVDQCEYDQAIESTDEKLNRMGGAVAVTEAVNSQLKQEQIGTDKFLKASGRDPIRWSPDDTRRKASQ